MMSPRKFIDKHLFSRRSMLPLCTRVSWDSAVGKSSNQINKIMTAWCNCCGTLQLTIAPTHRSSSIIPIPPSPPKYNGLDWGCILRFLSSLRDLTGGQEPPQWLLRGKNEPRANNSRKGDFGYTQEAGNFTLFPTWAWLVGFLGSYPQDRTTKGRILTRGER